MRKRIFILKQFETNQWILVIEFQNHNPDKPGSCIPRIFAVTKLTCVCEGDRCHSRSVEFLHTLA